MQSIATRASQLQRPAGLAGSSTYRHISATRQTVLCRVVDDVTTTLTDPPRKVTTPQWVPAVAHPVLDPALNFLAAQDFKLQESWVYRNYLSIVTENEFVVMSTGFKELPEIINGRGAMLGFVAAAVAEIFSGGTVAEQLSAAPRPVLAMLGLIIAGSLIPIIRGAKDETLEAIKLQYGIPPSVFTPENERIHGRLAMVGLGTMLFLELLFGHKVL